MNEKEIHLRDYLRVIAKRKGSVITFFILTLIVVIIATFTATPMYHSGTKVMIERNTSDALSTGYRYTPYDPEFIETQNQLIMSTAVVRKAIKALNPDKIYTAFFPKESEKPSYFQTLSQWMSEQYAGIKKNDGSR